MQYLTWVTYYATETNPVKLGRGKMMNNKKKKPHPKREKSHPRHNYIVQKESENPDQPLEIPTQNTKSTTTKLAHP